MFIRPRLKTAMAVFAGKWQYEAEVDRCFAEELDNRESSMLHNGIACGKLEAAEDLLKFLETGRMEIRTMSSKGRDDE